MDSPILVVSSDSLGSLIYEISISYVKVLEQTVSKYIRKWLGLHRTISSIALYSKLSPLPSSSD